MVILKRIYSNTDLFNEIKFKPGINIIEGVIDRSKSEHRGLNGIGKSTLIRLIDFALISDTSTDSYFDVQDYDFLKSHSVTLEFEAEGTSYYINRKFDDPTNPMFGMDSSSLKIYPENELKTILGDIFFGTESCQEDSLKKTWFRDLINFFIKDDLNHNDRKDPLNFFSQHKTLHVMHYYNLYLLCMPNKSVLNFDIKTKESRQLQGMKRRFVKNLKEDTGIDNIEKTTFEILQIDAKIREIQKALDDFNFVESNKEIEEIINTIIVEKSTLVNKRRVLKRKLEEYQQSYNMEDEIDFDKIVYMYNEVKKVFGDAIRTELDDVFLFRKTLAKNRSQFLKEITSQLKKDIDEMDLKIIIFEKERSKLYKRLDEKKALDVIKNTQIALTEEKIKKERILLPILQIKKIDKDVANIHDEITQTISGISKEIELSKHNIRRLSSIYYEIIETKIQGEEIKEAFFEISSSLSMTSPLKINIEIPKKHASGYAKFKILAYDLTVFFNQLENKRHFPHFLIHDGVFGGIDKKSFVNILNYIDSKYNQMKNFQYIITANDYEFVSDEERNLFGNYNFDLSDCIIATYKDIPQEMIFRREY